MTFFRQFRFPTKMIQRLASQPPHQPVTPVLFGILLSSVIGFNASTVNAQSSETAPPELVSLLDNIETAANRQDIEAVMAFYDSDFTHTDGFDRRSLQQSLTQFWQQYSDLNYEMELQSWEQNGSTIVATTITTITGNKTFNNRQFKLEATVTSEQRIEDQQIIQQEVIAEKNKLTAGENPPTVTFNAPETVSINQTFNVDAIVQEPLGEDILLGAAVEQSIDPDVYFSPKILEMELLNTGGLFKIGEASATPDQRWISAVLIRKGGIVSVTQRVQILP
ncbi:MAG: nuclear transport factor 2 family protein [Microcoleaceae cyanobacterium]